MIDAVLSYHADGLTCGVTRFSQQLAKRLDVPWGLLSTMCAYPLLSLKPSEVKPSEFLNLSSAHYDLFLHESYPTSWSTDFLEHADRVFTASQAIAGEIRPFRASVMPAWCPSLVEAQPREPITVLSFGMAHKIRTDLYATLKEKLDATGEPYVVYVSAALHEGTTFSQASESFETLRKLFGMNFVFLGTLSEEAMVDRLRTCTYVAAFFEKGLRENNTSVMAALQHGAMVLTNCDDQTPTALRALVTDIGRHHLPHIWQRWSVNTFYGWDKLVELIRAA